MTCLRGEGPGEIQRELLAYAFLNAKCNVLGKCTSSNANIYALSL
jgi:hypothetical protein